MFICFNPDIENDVYTTIDTSDFAVEELTQEQILRYQSGSNDKVKVFDSELCTNNNIDNPTKAVLYRVESLVLYMLVLEKGSDDTLFGSYELSTDAIDVYLNEDEDLVIVDTEDGEETIISLNKGES